MTDRAEGRAGARRVWAELRPTLSMALPLVLAELGWMAMGVVDTIMVGRLGPAAIGAVGLGSSLHLAVIVFGSGLLLGLDSVVSRAFGAGDLDECHRSLVQGSYLALIFTPLSMGLVWLISAALPRMGIDPEVAGLAGPFLNALNWSTPPLMAYAVLRRYVQGMSRVRIVTLALVFANVVNLLGNYAFIYGRFGLPAFGTSGSGWSTCLSRAAMAAVLLGHVVLHERRRPSGLWETSLRPDFARLGRLCRLGLPAAVHVALEVGVFATATALAARFDAVALAAHQIVLETSSVTFMVPYGVSSVGAIRVGQALGRREPLRAAAAGWAAFLIGEGFMTLSGLCFLLLPRMLVGFYTNDALVVPQAVTLLAIAAAFQLFDGLQVVGSGVLRGSGDTHTTMYVNLVAYWVVGLPVGTLLAFRFGRGVPGLWIGLSVGLMAAGAVLLTAWSRRARRLAAES